VAKIKNTTFKYNKLLAILPYLILGIVLYLPYIFFFLTFNPLSNDMPEIERQFFSNMFGDGFIATSIIFIASAIFLYFLKLRKKLNIYLLLSLIINAVFITSIIFYVFSPFLDISIYTSVKDKMCSVKSITAMGDYGIYMKKYCNKIDFKPRNKTINYTVTKDDAVEDDTLENVSHQFNISTDTIVWENNLTTDLLKKGQILKILPVTGVSYIVKDGDNLDSIAAEFKTTKQKIISYPYNEYADPVKFILIPGSTIIIPDGKK
jgi:LysM repeat protein